MPEVRLSGALCLTHNPAYSPGQGQATSYLNPVGPESGVGYVWMMESDAEALDFDAPQSLSIDATESIALPRLYVDSAVAASGISPTDGQRAYLLTLRDSRLILSRQTDVNAAINCRPGAAPTNSTAAIDPNEFYQSTLNPLDNLPYEWNDAIAWLWSLCPASLVGAYPGLPYQPEGIPQNIRGHGVSAWKLLHDLLGRVQMTTAYDPVNDRFAIIDLGEPQPSLAAVAGYSARVLNDRFPGGSAATRIPAAIRVYFLKQAQHFGTEQDTPRVNNWQDFGAQYWQDVPTQSPGAVPGTVVSLHDDAPAMVDFNGLVTNLAELTARAVDRAANWVAAKLLQVARGSLIVQGVAAGLAAPGSQVSHVLFRNFGDGWMTELALKPLEEASGVGHKASGENFSPPDFGRRTWPSYPRVAQLVRVTNSQKDGNGLCQGLVVRGDPSQSYAGSQIRAYTSLEPCLVAGVNGEAFTSGDVYLARLNGVAFSSASGWAPLYLAQPAGAPMLVQMQADCPFGQSAKATQVVVPKGQQQGGEQPGQPPQTFTVFNKLFGLLRKNSFVWVDNDGDGWYAVTALGNAFAARVVSGQANSATGYCAVETPINCTLVDEAGGSLNETQVTISAVPVYAPVIDNELVFVEYVWPASQSMERKWIITRGELDGGFIAQTQSSSSQIASGASALVNPQPQYLGAATLITANQNVLAQFALGGVNGLKLLWVSRNRGGFFVTAAQC